VKKVLFKILDSTSHIALLVSTSKKFYGMGRIGRLISRLIDKAIRIWYGMELSSFSINVKNLSVGHSVGLVLGGNGITVTGTLRVNSGVVFGRKQLPDLDSFLNSTEPDFFYCNGDLTVGANAVLLGPLKIEGPTVIGAGSVVIKDIAIPGVYVGNPLRRVK
jgi:serine acetyltransferase